MSRVTLEIPTPEGVVDATAHVPTSAGPWPAVLFFMDGVGLREELRLMADRLAANGFYTLLPNLYYRAGAFAPFDGATVWGDPPERARLGAVMGTVKPETTMRDVGLYLDLLARTPNVDAAQVGCVGYCLGGQVAFRAAAAHPERIAAAASIHGGHLVTDAPDSPHLAASKLRARLYFAHADADRSCTREDRATLETALLAAGVHFESELYVGKGHGFAVRGLPPYDESACERHWERVLALFDDALEP